jgi:chemotaxis protein CheZ
MLSDSSGCVKRCHDEKAAPLWKSGTRTDSIGQFAAVNLAAALKDGIDRGLAQDIRDRVVQIFEACNFQDLTSQRVTKVIKALKEIEAEIASALAEIVPGGAAPAVGGPRLESDRGHASQRDIDILFDRA